MTALATMKFLILLALLGAATGYRGHQSPTFTRVATTSPSMPPVFGFEFTLDGVVTSASLPNGTIIPVGITHGSAAYRAEMWQLYATFEGTRQTHINPAVVPHERHPHAGKAVRPRSGPYDWKFGPVTELRDAVTAAKRAALDELAETYGLTDLGYNDTFHALAAVPSFIFTTRKPGNRGPFDSWQGLDRFDQDAVDSPPLSETAWLTVTVTRFSQVGVFVLKITRLC
jgi:hypothetical protein